MSEAETKTIALKKAIEHGGQTYGKLDLCEPTAGQMEKAGVHANGVTSNIMLLADVASWPPDAVRKIPKREFEEAIDFLRGFTFAAPTTGETS